MTITTTTSKKVLSAWLVGTLRGAGLAAATSGIGALIVTLGGIRTGTLAPFAPLAVIGLRSLEGLIDQKRGAK